MCPRTSVSFRLSFSSAPPPLDYILQTVSLTALFVTFFLFQPPNSVSIYCPSVTLSGPLIAPAPVSLSLPLLTNSPWLLAAFEVRTVVTEAGCV